MESEERKEALQLRSQLEFDSLKSPEVHAPEGHSESRALIWMHRGCRDKREEKKKKKFVCVESFRPTTPKEKLGIKKKQNINLIVLV